MATLCIAKSFTLPSNKIKFFNVQLKKCVIILKNIKYCSQYAQQAGGQSAADCAAQSVQQFSLAIQLPSSPACPNVWDDKLFVFKELLRQQQQQRLFNNFNWGNTQCERDACKQHVAQAQIRFLLPLALPLACMFIPLTLTCLHLRPLPVYDFMLQSMANCANCLNDFAWVNNLHDLLRPSPSPDYCYILI